MWFWLNIPIAAVLFAAMAGIALWLVIKHPDTGEETMADAGCRAAVPIYVASMDEEVRCRDAA